MISEIWKDVVGYEGYYMVSNLGKVKSLDMVILRSDGRKIHHKGKMLSPTTNNKGYYMVNLHKNSKHKFCTIHRLVAKAFIPNPYDLPCVNHKDENPKNCNVDNLEWCDYTYNNNYGTRSERARLTKMNGKLCKAVNQYTINGELIKQWVSTKQVERELGYSNCCVGRCCRGLQDVAYGYKWQYA